MTTKHTCGGPIFGKKTPGCPRCDELLSGAAPVQWGQSSAKRSALYLATTRKHNCIESNCGVFCTYGDW